MSTYVPPFIHACNLLNQLKIDMIPTPVEDICNKLNIDLKYNDEMDAEALLLKGGKLKSPIIVVNTANRYGTRTRFSIAHELGHYYIPNHINEIYTCTLIDLDNYQSNKLVEKEANEFAAELLMPNAWIKNAIKSIDVSLELLKTLSNKCETSLTATALQVSNSCSDRIAVVYSKDERIVWFNKAQSFNLYLVTGKLSKLSIAAEMFSSGGLLSEKKDSVPIEAWTHDDRNYKILIEDSLYMPYLNSVLTLLTIPYDEYDEEDDELFY